MKNYLIVLPPSETKLAAGTGSFQECVDALRYVKDFEHVHKHIQKTIQAKNHAKLEKVFEMKGRNLDRALQKNTNLMTSEVMPAIQRYTGVMYDAIDVSSLDADTKNRASENICIIDGLFGCLRGSDLIPDYKCKINTKLTGLDVSVFWQEKLVDLFDPCEKDTIILDLLPDAHKKVIPPDTRMVEIVFMDRKSDGSYKKTGHHAKALKGHFVRYILGYEYISEEILTAYAYAKGYTYAPELSTSSSVVYTNKK